MIESFDGAIYFFMKYYYNCLSQKKGDIGCENYINFFKEERFQKKLLAKSV